MIHNLNEDTGHIQWRCHHAKCAPLSAHISHPGIEWIEHNLVALPPCKCGSRCFVRVNFTEEELQAVNMQEYGMVPQEMTVPHAITGEPVPVLIPAFVPVGPNPAIARHQAFEKLLKKHGRPYVVPKESSEEPHG